MIPYTYHATITNVVDGDTVDAMIDLGFGVHIIHRLRLLGVDTPELNSKDPVLRETATQAKKYVLDAVLGKAVIIESKKSDKYGRYLAAVRYLDSTLPSLNDQLVTRTLAAPYMT